MEQVINLLLDDSRSGSTVIGLISGGMFGVLGAILGGCLQKKLNNPKALKWTVIIAIVISFQIPLLVRAYFKKEGYRLRPTAEENLKYNSEAAEKINKQAPIKIDDVTTLLSAKGRRDGILYNYRMEVSKSDLSSAQEVDEKLRPSLIKNACNEKTALDFLRSGNKYIYSYVDIKGEAVAVITVTQEDCER